MIFASLAPAPHPAPVPHDDPSVARDVARIISALQDAQELLRGMFGGGMATMPPLLQREYQRREDELRQLRATTVRG
ncbi:hypothetical protein [Roseisolibacter agri]|uniref:Uncharacterized protein n=1 Tax=Roseisolibacter agri TaxID=2014610 RepID=A0AA37VA50_9BACT|nr:hypothetical protein [Roseisolibacter agri]GLC25078.1 hypothetical protein rosag_15910 [Roseisolibacter agri]